MSVVDSVYGLYQRTPVAFQNLIVSAYGWVLHRRRYGEENERTLAWLMETKQWDRERLLALQMERLRETLLHAAETVPFYRRQWKEIGFDPRDVRTLADFQQLPITEKEQVRQKPEDFVSDAYDLRRLVAGRTSGTTGKPLVTFKDRGCYQRVWAFQGRQRRIWGITGEGARVSIGVRPVVPAHQTRPPFWRHDLIEDNWLFSNFHMSEQTLGDYVEKIAEIQPEEINAYPSGIYLVAAHALKMGVDSIRPQGIISSAETLHPYQRDVIERAFGCRVADQYGIAELSFWTGQCPHGTFHIAPEFGILESIDGATPVVGQPGDAVGTGFINRAQVLIRYRVGDQVILPEQWTECACGWQTDAMSMIVGRIDDVLYTPEGRALPTLRLAVKKAPGVLESQLVQDARDHLTVKLVAEESPNERSVAAIRQPLEELFGPAMRFDFEWCDEIPRTKAGKFRYQLNLVGPPDSEQAGRTG